MVRVLAWPAYRNRAENPYNALLYEAVEARGVEVSEFSPYRALRGNYDILHIHWPDALLKNVNPFLAAARVAALGLILLIVRVVQRRAVIWTVHNSKPHGGSSMGLLWRILSLILNRLVSGQIFLSSYSREAYARKDRQRRHLAWRVIYHGRYGNQYVSERPASEVRAELGLDCDSMVLGHVGSIRPYKGALELIRVFRGADIPKCQLLIAGGCDDTNYRDQLISAAGGDPRIVFHWGWLGKAAFAELTGSCDVIAFPYQSILNSGSVFVPLELNTPVIAPAMGSLPEIAVAVGPQWLRLYEGQLDKEVLGRALAVRPKGAPDLRAFEWGPLAEATVSFYRSILGGKS